jgi:Methyltransferase FkbM domain
MSEAQLPTRRVVRKVPEEGREYDVTLHAPYRFAQEIATAQPRFSNRFAVNLGAGDGVSCNDPVLPLYQAGWAGLAVERERNAALLVNLPAPSIRKLISTLITPDNVAELLADNGCPATPDLLKLDIDGYDGPVLLEILRAGFRPKVIQLEVQPEIPPPIEFAVLYDPAYRCVDSAGKVGGFYGASLGYVCNLGRRFGYFPVQLDFVTGFTHDVTLVSDRYRDLMLKRFGITERDDRDLFLAHPPGYSHFRADDGIDTRSWRRREDHHALLRTVWDACIAACQRKHGTLLPFHLAVA